VSAGSASTTLNAIGATLQLTALDAKSNAIDNGAVIWSPQTGSLPATVNATGLVTAKANGSQDITATAGGSPATVTINVSQVTTSVTVAPPMASIAESAKQQFTATANDANGHPVAVSFTWSSSDMTVATIDSSGLATASASKTGTVTITATGGGKLGTASLTVTTAALFGLTINNYLAWCDVTAKVGATTVASLTGSTTSATISPQQPAGTTVALTATPHTGFTTAHWQGTTTNDTNGHATYVMSTGSSQSLSACCPFADGSGCPF